MLVLATLFTGCGSSDQPPVLGNIDNSARTQEDAATVVVDSGNAPSQGPASAKVGRAAPYGRPLRSICISRQRSVHSGSSLHCREQSM
jgi:hypothetical protein